MDRRIPLSRDGEPLPELSLEHLHESQRNLEMGMQVKDSEGNLYWIITIGSEEFSGENRCWIVQDKEGRHILLDPDKEVEVVVNTLELDPNEDESVDHPSHYGGDVTYEIIKIEEATGLIHIHHLCSCIEYIFRHRHKGTPVKDLKKARWWLDRYIARLENGMDKDGVTILEASER